MAAHRPSVLIGPLVVAAVALAFAPAAVAAPQGPWQLPASELSESGQNAEGPEVAIATDGTATAVWRRRHEGLSFITQVATRPPGGTFGAAVNLSATGQSALDQKIAVAPDGTATVVWRRSNGANSIVQASTRPPGGSFGPPVDISETGGDTNGIQIAVAQDGTAGVVWHRFNGSNYIAQATFRPPGGSFGTPQNLSGLGKNAFDPQIEFGPDGSATVVWESIDGTDNRVWAATRPAGGPFGTPVILSAPGQGIFSLSPQIAISSGGDTTVVWSHFDAGYFIAQAVRRPSGGSFGTPVDLSATGGSASRPRVGIGPGGTAMVVWSRDSGLDDIVQASTRPPGGVFGPAEDLSAPAGEAFDPEPAIAPDGTATVVWSRRPTGLPRIAQATTRPPGGSFGPPVDLSASGQDANNIRLAIGPDGRATAVWYRSNGANNIIEQASTEPSSFPLAVTRSGTGSGRVTSAPAGIDCGPDCSEGYLSYTKVTLTAKPEPGNRFAGWSGACADAAGNSCEITMLEATEAGAGFMPRCRKATLRLNKIKRNRKNGTATVVARVGTAGRLVLKGSKNNPKARKKAAKNGRYKLKLRAKGKAARKLKKKGSFKVKARVVFKPVGNCSNKTRSKKVKLVRR